MTLLRNSLSISSIVSFYRSELRQRRPRNRRPHYCPRYKRPHLPGLHNVYLFYDKVVLCAIAIGARFLGNLIEAKPANGGSGTEKILDVEEENINLNDEELEDQLRTGLVDFADFLSKLPVTALHSPPLHTFQRFELYKEYTNLLEHQKECHSFEVLVSSVTAIVV
ncbi:hypothetical protein AJ79_05122 [Helicocarpus griseus UAMH5409]|uniref:Uncharacterized protein n=1 Tax=Helicocarpus griseus UAMH5409 TaxID=1447875 RepID=A0A2B7XQC2_9EURO|nr:hypothetical protein AJ79_05122 [Helicocarpus griseus UAMH5409]